MNRLWLTVTVWTKADLLLYRKYWSSLQCWHIRQKWKITDKCTSQGYIFKTLVGNTLVTVSITLSTIDSVDMSNKPWRNSELPILFDFTSGKMALDRKKKKNVTQNFICMSIQWCIIQITFQFHMFYTQKGWNLLIFCNILLLQLKG